MRLALLLALCGIACRSDGRTTLVVDGRTRSYELFVPSDAPNMPLVIALHGGGGSGKAMRRLTGFDAIAARERFVVVYPDGVNQHWRDGRPGIGEEGVDDVAFVRALVDELAAKYRIDRARVFATGISNGAMMSYTLACELGGTIKAIAPVAGNLDAAIAPACRPPAPVSVLAIEGDADPIVPYGGGQVNGTRGEVLSASASVAHVAAADGCGPEGPSIDEADRDPGDGTRARHVAYACPAPVAVELVTISGGGHTWPGGPQYLPRATVGLVGRDFDASERIWQFFAR